MRQIIPTQMICLGFLLVLFGFVAPFLMTIGLVEPSFWLSFLSHAASVSGLFLGIIGSASYVRTNRR
jgi:hypothetical protein